MIHRPTAAAAVVIAVVASVVVARPAAAEEKVKLAVLDLRGQGVPDTLVASLTEVLTASFNELGVFDVLSRADIERMLDFDAVKQNVGCDELSCLAEIGGALGVALLVSGTVGKVGTGFLVNLTLTDSKAATVQAREQRQVEGEDALPEQVRAAARYLVRGLLEARQGFLVLKVSEAGADVEIDGRLAGVTPLPRTNLASGPHKVRVVRTGFITWARDVDIVKDDTAVVDASLVPSVEFIDAYDATARAFRISAVALGAVGLGAVGFAIGAWAYNDGQIATYERELAAANCQDGAQGSPTVASCADFESRRAGLQNLDIASQVAGGLGVAAIAAGVFLFFYGPELGAYDQYRPAAGVAVVPSAGGAMVSGVFGF